MREIKFRYYIKEIKEFIYFKNGLYYRNNEVGSYIFDWNNCEQFTGLHDKNGKEIYEGDILKDYYSITGAVISKDGCFKVDYKNYGKYCLNDREKHVIEIIGNIHENPELLEK